MTGTGKQITNLEAIWLMSLPFKEFFLPQEVYSSNREGLGAL